MKDEKYYKFKAEHTHKISLATYKYVNYEMF